MNSAENVKNLNKIFKKAEKNRKKGRNFKAITQYFHYLDLNKNDLKVWISLAYCFNKEEGFKQAIWAGKHALKIDNEMEGAMDNLFYSYDLTGEYKLAIRVLKRYLKVRLNSKRIMLEKEFNIKHYELYKDLKFNGILLEENNRIPQIELDEEDFERLKSVILKSVGKKQSETKEDIVITLTPETLKEQGIETVDEFLRVFNEIIPVKIIESPIDSPEFSRSEIPLGFLPPKDGNISKLYLENNVEFHILTLFEYSHIGKTDYMMRLLKLVLRYFPFNEKAWDKLALTFEN